jgi:hypothetical protein
MYKNKAYKKLKYKLMIILYMHGKPSQGYLCLRHMSTKIKISNITLSQNVSLFKELT